MNFRSSLFFVVSFSILIAACGGTSGAYKKSVDKAGDRAVDKQQVEVSLPSGSYSGRQRVILRLKNSKDGMDILVEDKPGLENVACTDFEKASSKATCLEITQTVEVAYFVTLEIDRPDLLRPWKKKKKGYAGDPKFLNYEIKN